jgi:uncharacterized protein (DUF2236 family)
MTSTAGSSALAPEDGTLRRAPLGPDSLTWKYFGDRRLLLFVGRSGTLQNMHPAVGAALQQHSNFFDNPWDRIFRSIPYILGTVYDPQPEPTAQQVRDFHKDLKGIDSRGERYHALNPDVYWWTHVTFVELVIAINEHFGTPLTEAQKDQVVAEGVTWWERYGLSSRPVITTYAEFEAYWNRMLDQELEANATTDYALRIGTAEIPPPPRVPAPAWAILRRPVMAANVWLATALMPERGREILGMSWSTRDQRLFETFATIVRVGWPLLPAKLRYYDRAYVNMKRAAV